MPDVLYVVFRKSPRSGQFQEVGVTPAADDTAAILEVSKRIRRSGAYAAVPESTLSVKMIGRGSTFQPTLLNPEANPTPSLGPEYAADAAADPTVELPVSIRA